LQDDLWSDANEAPDLVSFRRAALIRLAKLIGYDTAVVAPAPHPLGYDDAGVVFGVDYDPLLLKRFVENRARYWADLRRFLQAMVTDGFAINTDVYSGRELETLSMCVEIHIPAGTKFSLGASVTFRGHSTCSMALNRNDPGRPFRPRDLEDLRALLPALGIADAAMVARCTPEPVIAQPAPPLDLPVRPVDALTPREREVATLVGLGLHNKEIAAALGTSVETVRKQTVSVYAKLRVSGRVELAMRLMGDLRG
jgi:DNA-binding CsgD family transcriptional regulator